MNDFIADDIASTQSTARHRRRPTARRSSLSEAMACYVEDRLLKAHAIAAVITSVFDGVDADDRNDAALMGALSRTRHLVCECGAYLESAPELQFSGPICTTDPWWSDLEEAEALLDVATGISTIGFITEGLRAALKIEEVCHA